MENRVLENGDYTIGRSGGMDGMDIYLISNDLHWQSVLQLGSTIRATSRRCYRNPEMRKHI